MTIAEDSRDPTSFTKEFGLYWFKKDPFSNLYSGVTFNEVAESISKEVNDEVFCSYMDDSLAEKHVEVFTAIRSHRQL